MKLIQFMYGVVAMCFETRGVVEEWRDVCVLFIYHTAEGAGTWALTGRCGVPILGYLHHWNAYNYGRDSHLGRSKVTTADIRNKVHQSHPCYYDGKGR